MNIADLLSFAWVLPVLIVIVVCILEARKALKAQEAQKQFLRGIHELETRLREATRPEDLEVRTYDVKTTGHAFQTILKNKTPEA